jgi:hypothetical protein
MSRCLRKRGSGLLAVLILSLAGGSCGKVVREGRSSSYLIVDMLTAASGAQPANFGNTLESDVVTNVKTTVNNTSVLVPTVYEDPGEVRLRMALKNVGGATSPATPTSNNEITVTSYRVVYRRADGRNTAGVDVPYPFDGAVTGTISSNATGLDFVLVRGQAKLEAPLMAMRGMGGSVIMSTIAEVTFYGHDQVGNQVSVTGMISVNFADWGDPL